MTKYDFQTLINRNKQGSYKWSAMKKINPDTPDDIVPFSVADMELKNAPEIIEGLKDTLDNYILGYSGPTDDYIEAVIDWQKRRHNFHVEKEWIVLTSGVVSAFFNAIPAFTQPSDAVIIMPPVYYPFFRAVKASERTLFECPLLNNNHKYTIDFDKFEELASRPETKLLLFCSPHNPVARVWTREELEKLASIIIKNDLILISDEIHNDLTFNNHKHTVFQTISDELAQRTITMTSATKSFNLAGIGISNIFITNSEYKKRFQEQLQKTASSPFSTLNFQATKLAYTKAENWLDELLKHIWNNYNYTADFFKKHLPLLDLYPLEGTYLAWFDCRKLNLDDKELEHFMTHKALLFLDEGYIFGTGGSGFERINLATPLHILEKALQRLKSAYDLHLNK